MNNYKILKYCDFILEDSYDKTTGTIIAVEGLKEKDYKYFPFKLKDKIYHLFALSNDNDLTNFLKPNDLIFNSKFKHYFGICPQNKNFNFNKNNVSKSFLELVKHYFENEGLDFDDDIQVQLFNFNNFNNSNNFEDIEL